MADRTDEGLRLQDVHKSVVLPGGRPLDILSGVDLTVMPGEFVAILGRSGSGKTTLLNILGLIDRLDTGRYLIDGRDVEELSDRALSHLRGRVFGFVFQSFTLLDRRDALANVAAPLSYATRSEYRRRTQSSLHALQGVGLGDRLHSYPGQLSGGEQQRVAIARSLVRKPRYILADEPTGSLDVKTGEQVLAILTALVRESNAAMVLITHDPAVAERADRRLELLEGRLSPAP